MNAFSFKKGRPIFGHNTNKRLRPDTGIELAFDYIHEDCFDTGIELPIDNLEIEQDQQDQQTELEPIHVELFDEDSSEFIDLLRGAKLLQGSVVEVCNVQSK